MASEGDICSRFESQLAQIADLDHAYYMDPEPTAKDRTDYFDREQRRELIRIRFYAELDALRSRN